MVQAAVAVYVYVRASESVRARAVVVGNWEKKTSMVRGPVPEGRGGRVFVTTMRRRSAILVEMRSG